jgi:hypothetical protein
MLSNYCQFIRLSRAETVFHLTVFKVAQSSLKVSLL